MEKLGVKQVGQQCVVAHSVLRKHQKQSGLLTAQDFKIEGAFRGQSGNVTIGQHAHRGLGLGEMPLQSFVGLRDEPLEGMVGRIVWSA